MKKFTILIHLSSKVYAIAWNTTTYEFFETNTYFKFLSQILVGQFLAIVLNYHNFKPFYGPAILVNTIISLSKKLSEIDICFFLEYQ